MSMSKEIFTFYKSLLPEYLIGQHEDFINCKLLNDVEGFNIPLLSLSNNYSLSGIHISHPCFHTLFANHGKTRLLNT